MTRALVLVFSLVFSRTSLRLARCGLLPVALSLVVACKSEGTATPEPARTAVSAASTAAVTAPPPVSARHADAAKEHGRRRRGGSLAASLIQAARDIDLTSSQTSSLKEIGDHQGERGGPPPELKAYQAALVAQVRAGKIEPAKLDPLHAAVEKALEARQAKEAETLNGLYAILEPTQRKVVANTVRTRLAERKDPPASDAGPPARLESLAKQLDLDAAPQKKIEPLIAKDPPPETAREEQQKYADAVLAAFAADGFDAKKISAPLPARAGTAAHTQFLAALLPLLKPEQREKLAASIETQRGPSGGAPGEEPPKQE